MMKLTTTLAIIATVAFSALSPEKDDVRQFQQIVSENGYALEHYSLVTKDDYVLTLYRIPGKFSKEKQTEPKPVVFMMHSQNWDMTQWVSNDADKSNAFLLSEAGYDVWMGNNRGSTFSRGHTKYTRDDFEFWQFYQEEMGTIDVPTFIDFITDKTGVPSVSYVGHSEGTTQMFIGLSLMPEYFKEKVNVFAAMAPPVYLRSIEGGAKKEAAHWKLLQDVVEKTHFYNTFVFKPQQHEALATVCNLLPHTCAKLAKDTMLVPEVDNMSRDIVMMANMPSGASYRTFLYYAQCVDNGGNFRRFDYGKDANMALYGSQIPPDYPVEDIDMPIAIFNGDRDPDVLEADVEFLIEKLGDNVVFHKVIPGDHWTFTMAQDMSWYQKDLINVLQTYNPTTPAQFLQ